MEVQHLSCRWIDLRVEEVGKRLGDFKRPRKWMPRSEDFCVLFGGLKRDRSDGRQLATRLIWFGDVSCRVLERDDGLLIVCVLGLEEEESREGRGGRLGLG